MGVQVVLGGQVHNSSTHGQPNNSSVQGSARLCVDCEVRVMQCFQMRCVAAWRSPPPAYLPRPLSLPVPPAVSQHLTHPRATRLPLPCDASVTAPACYSLPLSFPYLAPWLPPSPPPLTVTRPQALASRPPSANLQAVDCLRFPSLLFLLKLALIVR